MAAPAPAPPEPQRIVIRGERRRPLQDIYHGFLRKSWSWTLAAIAGGFLAVNLIFALIYWAVGGVAGAHGFLDYLFFSVQTAGTVGYGAMYPVSTVANVLMVAESVAGLIVAALATGLVFAKFSRSRARMRFSEQLCITPINQVPTLTFRIGNERGNAIVEAHIHLTLSRTEISTEGERFYRQYDLALVRDRAPALLRTFTVMHPITEWSVLSGATPESLAACEAEVLVSVTGIDDTSMQTVHARRTYDQTDIEWGKRHADLLIETPDEFVVDLDRFDDVIETVPTEVFPYPRPAPAGT